MGGLAAGPATVVWAQRAGWAGDDGLDLAASYTKHDPIAVAAVDRSAQAVGEGIASLCARVDIEIVAIGGGFSNVSSDYIDQVESAAHRAAILPAAGSVRVVRAVLGHDAPLIGAARLELDHIGRYASPERQK